MEVAINQNNFNISLNNKNEINIWITKNNFDVTIEKQWDYKVEIIRPPNFEVILWNWDLPSTFEFFNKNLKAFNYTITKNINWYIIIYNTDVWVITKSIIKSWNTTTITLSWDIPNYIKITKTIIKSWSNYSITYS